MKRKWIFLVSAFFLVAGLSFALSVGVQDIQSIRKGNYSEEFMDLVGDLLTHPAVMQLSKYGHHIGFTRLQHSVNVAYYNYVLSSALGLHVREATRAGLLHDFFLYDWRVRQAETGEGNHAQLHPKKALKTAQHYFDISEREADIIVNHMWPVTFELPNYAETFLITVVDKYCATMEVFSGIGDIVAKVTTQTIKGLTLVLSNAFKSAQVQNLT